MITQRAVIIGFVGVCFYLVALVNQLPSYYSILTWLSITILVSCAGVAAISLQGMRCSWRVLRSRAAASLDPSCETSRHRVLDAHEMGAESGSGPVLEIELINKGTLNKTGLVVEVTVRHLSRDLELTRRFLVESLPANNSVVSTLTLRGLPRGRYRVIGLSLIGADVLGLFRVRQRVFSDIQAKRRKFVPRVLPDPAATLRFYAAMTAMGFAALLVGIIARYYTIFGGWMATFGGALSALVGASGLASWWRSVEAMRAPRPRVKRDENAENQLIVGPATVEAGRLAGAAAAEESGSEAVQFDVLGRGDELRGTRPYVAGDDLRTVHWKSTARLGRLVVKEFHRPARTQCVVIWDGTRGAASSLVSGETAESLRSSTRKVMRALQNVGDETQSVEMALSLTASLCRAWLERGLNCTLLSLSESGAQLIAHSSGRGLSAPYVEALADADADRTTPLAGALASRVRELPRHGDVFLVTTQASVANHDDETLTEDVRRAAALLQTRGSRVTVIVVTKTSAATERGKMRNLRAGSLSAALENSIPTRVWNDASGARVVVVQPPVERRQARRSRFAPPEEHQERRVQADSRLTLEHRALTSALELALRFDARSTGHTSRNITSSVPLSHKSELFDEFTVGATEAVRMQ